jgi:hypothetical protein
MFFTRCRFNGTDLINRSFSSERILISGKGRYNSGNIQKNSDLQGGTTGRKARNSKFSRAGTTGRRSPGTVKPAGRDNGTKSPEQQIQQGGDNRTEKPKPTKPESGNDETEYLRGIFSDQRFALA